MEYTMRKRNTIYLMVSTAVLLAACGGGGGNTIPPDTTVPTTPVNKPSFELKGTVPGTLIEAFCEDGSHYAVNSEFNTSNKHPFVLVLPTNLSCRLVMTTNENDPERKIVTPIKLINSDGLASIAFSGSEDIDLKHIDLPLNRDEMLADANNDGVEDIPKEIIINNEASSAVKIIVTENDPLDTDKDGVINIFEDDDGDKINNHDDDDDDGDGIPDSEDDVNDYENNSESEPEDATNDAEDSNEVEDVKTESDDDDKDESNEAENEVETETENEVEDEIEDEEDDKADVVNEIKDNNESDSNEGNSESEDNQPTVESDVKEDDSDSVEEGIEIQTEQPVTTNETESETVESDSNTATSHHISS